MDDNVMHIFGFVIKPIHVTVFYNTIFLLMGAGGIYAWFKTRWQSRGNRDMHRYVHSVNEVSDADREGYRTLKLRNSVRLSMSTPLFVATRFVNGSLRQPVDVTGYIDLLRI